MYRSCAAAHAPVQAHRPADAALERVLDDALHRRESRCARNEEDGAVAVLQDEAAERPFEAHRVPEAHALEYMAGEAPAGNAPHVQFDRVVLVRRIGEGEGAPRAVLEHDVDVLAGGELQRPFLRQGEAHAHHVVCQALERHHAAGVQLLRGARRFEALHIDHDVACRAPRSTSAPCRGPSSRRAARWAGKADGSPRRARRCRCTRRRRRCGIRRAGPGPRASPASSKVSPSRNSIWAWNPSAPWTTAWLPTFLGRARSAAATAAAAQQGGAARRQRPDPAQRPVVDERQQREVEPVEPEVAARPRRGRPRRPGSAPAAPATARAASPAGSTRWGAAASCGPWAPAARAPTSAAAPAAAGRCARTKAARRSGRRRCPGG